ncbi:1,4-alpha-glucan branching protein domain-containing protein [Alkalihalobacillus sp. 1P02AB]|uniref:1,4-alpha-glucan branching protein domain-containing protein n=1 Tax=Alkalihalobacillus sp. 1P02AB TaxID=3132260 RepID=UPI0039A617F8
MKEGYFSLVLHAHLPYVRHEEEERLEERWLFEAMTETYIPLIWSLKSAQVKEALTISFTPPLMEMLADERMQKRYLAHLDLTEQLILKELVEQDNPDERRVIKFYQERFQRIKETYKNYNFNILNAYKELKDQKLVTLMTSAATHAFLPYVQTKNAIRSQIVEGIRCFESHFGEKPLGFWLPECAFAPGIDRILVEEGIRYAFADEHAILSADPHPEKGSGAPIYTPHGLILFPRHTTLSSKVWSSTLGYPGDVDYREFYRDIAYERDWDYIQPFVHSEGIRIDTGLKYRRITANSEHKETYVREWAIGKIQAHADDYIHSIHQEVEAHGDQSYPPYLMVAPFDAELFGHWWFEGPEWIEALLKKGADSVSFITPEEYMHRHYYDFTTSHVSFSTWGRDGYGDVWMNETNTFLYKHYHQMEQDLTTTVALFNHPSSEQRRAMQQMVREWMLAVSSDWAFIFDGQSTAQYAYERFKNHFNRFNHLKETLLNHQLTEAYLTSMEQAFPFLEQVDEQVFLSEHDRYARSLKPSNLVPSNKKKILMLSWEFPPMMVGGLSRHVFDLSRALTKDGHEVHVLTSYVEGYPTYENNLGIHVYRVKGLQPKAESFFDWVGSLNMAMVQCLEKITRTVQFDIVHAHDWLVSVAAKAIKTTYNIPLLVTIHATEHGRNHGIHNDLQFEINQKEWELTYEADQIIVCSSYMKEELKSIFSLPEEKMAIIPNGVDIEQVTVHHDQDFKIDDDNRFTIFSVGRVVKEKGFETIIYAAENMREKGVDFKFVVAGKGPMLEQYRQLVYEKGLDHYVLFLGFISDEDRNSWLRRSDVVLFPSLYEPFGIVALEGMAAGKATIVSDTGGLADIIDHGKNGLKMIPGHVESLVDQVLYLFNHPIAREQLAEQGLVDVKSKYDWNQIAQQTLLEMDKCLPDQVKV